MLPSGVYTQEDNKRLKSSVLSSIIAIKTNDNTSFLYEMYQVGVVVSLLQSFFSDNFIHRFFITSQRDWEVFFYFDCILILWQLIKVVIHLLPMASGRDGSSWEDMVLCSQIFRLKMGYSGLFLVYFRPFYSFHNS